MIAVRLPSKPRVLVDGRLEFSPWIRSEELPGLRVIEVFYASSSLPPGAYQAEGHVAWRPWKNSVSK